MIASWPRDCPLRDCQGVLAWFNENVLLSKGKIMYITVNFDEYSTHSVKCSLQLLARALVTNHGPPSSFSNTVMCCSHTRGHTRCNFTNGIHTTTTNQTKLELFRNLAISHVVSMVSTAYSFILKSTELGIASYDHCMSQRWWSSRHMGRRWPASKTRRPRNSAHSPVIKTCPLAR